ncbi:MAG TPA: GIDE domain-containing protein [Candidatus Limnocylindria bacterium]|nr:GIDE domain-containing protein [Candidatus Limnocylindria bacterium]
MAIDFELPAYATAASVTGPILFYQGFRALRTLHLIRNTPTARIRSMAMGLVEINGSVVPRSTAIAPFTGRPCAYWEVDVAVRTRRSYSIVHRNQSGQPFYLRDETGLALVYPKGAELRITFAKAEECFGLNLPDCYASYLKEHGTLFTNAARMTVLRFRERILEESQQVYVMGSAMPRARAHVVSDEETLQATGTDGRPAGRVRSLDTEVAAVIRRGENERTFIISQDHEHQVAFGLGLKSGAMLLGGPALTLFGLGYWLVRWSSH